MFHTDINVNAQLYRSFLVVGRELTLGGSSLPLAIQDFQPWKDFCSLHDGLCGVFKVKSTVLQPSVLPWPMPAHCWHWTRYCCDSRPLSLSIAEVNFPFSSHILGGLARSFVLWSYGESCWQDSCLGPMLPLPL